MYGNNREIFDTYNHNMKYLKKGIGLKEPSLITSIAIAMKMYSNIIP